MRGRAFMAGLLVVVTPAAAGAAPAGRAAPWKVVKLSGLRGMDSLYDIVAAGPNAAWAVGERRADSNPRALAYHWNGRSWRRTPLPAGLGPSPRLAAAPGAGAWMLADSCAGSKGGSCAKSTILRWTGRAWRPVFRSGLLLGELAVAGRRDVWAFGTGRDRRKALHFDGRHWHRAKVPGEVVQAAAVSRTDIWAVAGGGEEDLGPAPRTVLHFDGRRWTTVRGVLPKKSGRSSRLSGISVIRGRVVLAGAFHPGWEEEGFLVRRTSKGWTREDLPPTHFGGWIPGAPVPDGRGGLWMRVWSYDDEDIRIGVAHRTGGGAWSIRQIYDGSGETRSVGRLEALAPAGGVLWLVGSIDRPEDAFIARRAT
ncbi:hypothetical protein [Actinocorallia longicatena]|uniref:Galactose oxidase-like protein n=1 Tax=Actinocorallia longicatena TaxID=111803 RepID=A0ABP6PWT3_9ACTN